MPTVYRLWKKQVFSIDLQWLICVCVSEHPWVTLNAIERFFLLVEEMHYTLGPKGVSTAQPI